MDFFHGVLIDEKISEFSKDKFCIERSRPPTSYCSSLHRKQRRLGADMKFLGVVGAKSALALAGLARFGVANINAKPSSETELVVVYQVPRLYSKCADELSSKSSHAQVSGSQKQSKCQAEAGRMPPMRFRYQILALCKMQNCNLIH